jgi:uncharacterized membrane protein HdeD (DUF308 family)
MAATDQSHSNPRSTLPMAKIFLALFLLIFGLNLVFGLNIPIWVTGVLALVAGAMLLMEYFSVRVEKK